MTAPAYPAVEYAANALAAAGLDVCVRPFGPYRAVVYIGHVRGTFTLEVYPNGEMCLWASGCEAPAYWGDGNVAAVLAAVTRLRAEVEAKTPTRHISTLELQLASLQHTVDELEADFHKPVFSPWFLDKHGTAHREALFGPSFIVVHPDGSYHARIYKADGDVVDEQKSPELDQSWSMYLADACAWWAGWRVPEKWSKDRGACDVAQLPVRSLR